MSKSKKRSLSKEVKEGFTALKKLRPAAKTLRVCNGCGKQLKRGEKMVCTKCFGKLRTQIYGQCARCHKKIRVADATFSATGVWCSDFCAERDLYERGLL